MVDKAEFRKAYKNSVDFKLKFRQRMFMAMIIILMTINIFNLINGRLTVLLALIGLVAGSVIGFFLSRMLKVLWHEEKEKVVSQLDLLGIILLIVYMIIELSRDWFVGHWLSGDTLAAFGLIFLTGLMIGRFIGTFRQIRKILRELILDPELD